MLCLLMHTLHRLCNSHNSDAVTFGHGRFYSAATQHMLYNAKDTSESVDFMENMEMYVGMNVNS